VEEFASKLPDGTTSRVRSLLRAHRVVVRLSPPRRTKLGDHRPPARGVPHHRITVNEDLNPYAFLMTLLHEIAHMTTWELLRPRSRRHRPHGREWKGEFARLLDPFVTAAILPEDLQDAVARSMQNPTAASCTDRDLVIALSKYDPPDRLRLRLEQLPPGSIFRVDNGQVFRLGARLRSRYQCFTQPGNREYRVHSLARVEPIQARIS
jgi:SprT protein